MANVLHPLAHPLHAELQHAGGSLDRTLAALGDVASFGNASPKIGPYDAPQPPQVELRLVKRNSAGTKAFGPCHFNDYAADQAFIDFVQAAGYQFVRDAQLEPLGFQPDQISNMHRKGYTLTKDGVEYRADPACPGGAIGYDTNKLAAELVRPRLPGTDVVQDVQSAITFPPAVFGGDPVAYFKKCLSLNDATLEKYFITNPKNRFNNAVNELAKRQDPTTDTELDERALARFVWLQAKRTREALDAQYKILMQVRRSQHQ